MTEIMHHGVAVVFQKIDNPIPIMPGAFNSLKTCSFSRHSQRSHCQRGATYIDGKLVRVPMMIVITYYVHGRNKDDDEEIMHMFLELLHESMHVHEPDDIKWPDSEDRAYEIAIDCIARWFPDELQTKLLQYMVNAHIMRKDPEDKNEVKESGYNSSIRRMVNRLHELKAGEKIYEE
jgi:hypothetical protein